MSGKPKRVTVLGGGAFGTAMAQQMGKQGIETRMWVLEAEARDAINNEHENKVFLPGCKLAETVVAYGALEDAFDGTEMVMVVIPTPFLRRFVIQNREKFPVDVPIVCCSKGIEKDTLDTPYEIMRDELPGKYAKYLACLSGPSFAAEVASGHQPTNVTVAAVDPVVAEKVQQYISDKIFRVYLGTDIISCEIAGACKNVLAIASGASDGFGFGYNARAALITRGLAEMCRLVKAKGGDDRTLMGLSGVGDLVLTCTGTLSRNYTTGKMLAEGKTIDEIKASSKAVAEGVFTALAIHQMAEKLGVDMPICEQVYKVIYEREDIKVALGNLQSRPLRYELD